MKGRHRYRAPLMESATEGIDYHPEGGEVTWPVAIGLAFSLFLPLALTVALFFALGDVNHT